jgi:hypothetical protein
MAHARLSQEASAQRAEATAGTVLITNPAAGGGDGVIKFVCGYHISSWYDKIKGEYYNYRLS